MKPLVRKSIFLWILLVCFSHCVTSLEILKNRSESESDSGSDEDSGQETLAVAEKLIQELDDISHRLDDDNQYIGDSQSILSDDIDHLEDIFRMVGRSINPSERNYEDIDEDFIRTKLTRKHVEELKRELRQVFFDPQFQERQGGSRPRPSLRLRPFGFLTRQRARQPPSDFLRPPSGNNRNNNRPNNNNNIGLQPGNPIFSGPVQVPQSSAPVPGFANNNFNPGNNINNNNFVRQQPLNDNRQNPNFRFPPNANLQQQQPLLPPPPPVQQQQQQQLLQQQQQQQQQRLRNPQFNNGPVQNPAFLPPQQQQPPPFIPSQPESPDNFRPVVNQQQLQQPQQGLGSVRNVQQPILSVPLQNFGQLNNFDVSGPPTAAGNSLSIPNTRPNLPVNINLINNNNINKNPIRNNNLNCEQFTEEICLDVRNYPGDVILNALTRNKPVVEAMLAEARSQSADDLIDGVSAAQERKYTYSHYYGNRRQGEDTHVHRDFASEGGFLCPSDVRYAKPRLAQNNRGVWKYIVNVAEYTQTLRMERCLKPDSSCSYVSPHYKSHCTQLFNYHRLLSWEQQRGLHVDIYKIPTACTCHIQGYAFLYPPLDGKTHGVLPPAFNTDNNNNTIPSTRRTDNNNPFSPPRNIGFSRSSTSSGPGARKSDFDSFMEQHEIGSLSNSWNRRTDLVADDTQDEPWETSATQQVPNRKKKQDKINYSYHPITDYFLPKSNRPASDRKRY